MPEDISDIEANVPVKSKNANNNRKTNQVHMKKSAINDIEFSSEEDEEEPVVAQKSEKVAKKDNVVKKV